MSKTKIIGFHLEDINEEFPNLKYDENILQEDDYDFMVTQKWRSDGTLSTIHDIILGFCENLNSNSKHLVGSVIVCTDFKEPTNNPDDPKWMSRIEHCSHSAYMPVKVIEENVNEE